MSNGMLLDTYVITWFAFNDRRLGRLALAAISQALDRGLLHVCAPALQEIGWLIRRGRFSFPGNATDFLNHLLEYGFRDSPVRMSAGALSGDLEWTHGDPIDRMLVACAIDRRFTLVTADRKILDWPGPLDRLDARM